MQQCVCCEVGRCIAHDLVEFECTLVATEESKSDTGILFHDQVHQWPGLGNFFFEEGLKKIIGNDRRLHFNSPATVGLLD